MLRNEFIRAVIFVGCIAGVYVAALAFLVRSVRTRQQPKTRAWRFTRAVVFALATVGIASFLYAYLVEPYRLDITHVQLTSPRLKPASSLRIVHFSDLHSGNRQRLEERIPGLIAAQHPDLIVFTGDLANSPGGLDRAKHLLAKLTAIAPVYAVRGNWDSPEVYSHTGVHELKDEISQLQVRGNWIQVIGSYSGELMTGLARAVPGEGYRVLLCHRPDQFEEVARSGNVDLFCAGHTHGGQVALPWYGALVTLTKTGKKYEAGLYHVHDTYLYVNRGIGMEEDAPLRFLARPEITVIDVKSAN